MLKEAFKTLCKLLYKSFKNPFGLRVKRPLNDLLTWLKSLNLFYGSGLNLLYYNQKCISFCFCSTKYFNISLSSKYFRGLKGTRLHQLIFKTSFTFCPILEFIFGGIYYIYLYYFIVFLLAFLFTYLLVCLN